MNSVTQFLAQTYTIDTSNDDFRATAIFLTTARVLNLLYTTGLISKYVCYKRN